MEKVRKCKIDFSEKLSMEWRAAEAFQKGGGENRAGGILFEKGPHDQVILHQSFPVLLGCILIFSVTVTSRVSPSKFFFSVQNLHLLSKFHIKEFQFKRQ